MNALDVAERTQWDANDLGELTAHIALFGEELPVVLFPAEGAGPEVTAKMVATLNEVIALPPAALAQVKQMLWDEANFAFEVADYGVEAQEGETPRQAHLREFGVADAEDAYALCTVREIHVRDEFASRFAEIKIDTVAENRISVIVKDGRIIDWDDDGTYLGGFEEDEEAAKKKRANVIG